MTMWLVAYEKAKTLGVSIQNEGKMPVDRGIFPSLQI